MVSEMKRALKLMWGSKRYRKAFGVHPVILAVYLACAVLFGGYPMLSRLLGEKMTTTEYYFCSVFPALFFLYFNCYVGNQFSAMFASGKSLLSFPVAKCALTKGVALCRLITFFVALFPTVFMRILCISLGLCEVSMLDDILLMYGIAYALSMMIGGSGFVWEVLMFLLGITAFANAIGVSLLREVFKTWSEKAYEYVMPGGAVAFFLAVLLAIGTALGLFVLERTYKKRRVVYNQAEIRMAANRRR